MSKASMPLRCSIALRIGSDQGSAPKTPVRSLRDRMSMPISSALSIRWRKYDGVQVITVTPKSFMMRIWRSVLPPLIGTTVAPRASAP